MADDLDADLSDVIIPVEQHAEATPQGRRQAGWRLERKTSGCAASPFPPHSQTCYSFEPLSWLERILPHPQILLDLVEAVGTWC
jgi:hypothetical protein